MARRPPAASAAIRSPVAALGQVRGEEAQARGDTARDDDQEPEHPQPARAPARGGEVRRRRHRLGDVRDEHRAEEADADREARCDLDAEDDRFGHAVDDGADDDAHRSSRSLAAVAPLDEVVTAEKHRDAYQHPDRHLPGRELLGFGDEVERDRGDQGARSEAGEDPHELARNRDPANEEAGEQERGLRQCSECERVEHARPLGAEQAARRIRRRDLRLRPGFRLRRRQVPADVHRGRGEWRSQHQADHPEDAAEADRRDEDD